MSQATVSEPAWLAGKRRAALETYTALPVPSNREEAWRFTNLRGFDPDAHTAHPGTFALDGEPGGAVFTTLAAGGRVTPRAGRAVSGHRRAREREVLGRKRRPLARRGAPARARRRDRRGAAAGAGRADRRGLGAVPPRAGGARARRPRDVRRGVPLGGARVPERRRRAGGRRRGPARVRHHPASPPRDAPVRHPPGDGRPGCRARLGGRGPRRARGPSRAWRACSPARAPTSR